MPCRRGHPGARVSNQTALALRNHAGRNVLFGRPIFREHKHPSSHGPEEQEAGEARPAKRSANKAHEPLPSTGDGGPVTVREP
eukprot:gene6553-6302_t